MPDINKLIIKAIKREDTASLKEHLPEARNAGIANIHSSFTFIPDQTAFATLLKCNNDAVIETVLDHGWELRYIRDFDILKKLTSDSPHYETAVKILEHPNAAIGIDCLKYFKAKGEKFADQRISDLVDYLNAAAEIACEQKELDAARKVIKKHAGQIKNLEAKQSKIADKGNLSAEFLERRKAKTKDDKANRQAQLRKESRLGI